MCVRVRACVCVCACVRVCVCLRVCVCACAKKPLFLRHYQLLIVLPWLLLLLFTLQIVLPRLLFLFFNISTVFNEFFHLLDHAMSTKKPLFLTDYQLLIVLCRFCFVDLADRAVVAFASVI